MTSSPIPPQTRETMRRFIREHDLLRPGPVVVAVSGGADSTALLLILADLADELGLVLHVAHFDHRLRRSGAADAQFVSELAARVGATVRVGRAERVPKSEDDARRARYDFLRRVAAERNAAVIATGHTRDDQAETVLLHLARGSGIAGLAGMRPSREGVVRPLLCIGRVETGAVCAAAGIAPREDPTNRSLRYARNRIRRRVIPELAQVNPQVTAALARLADAAADVGASQRERAAALLEAATRDGAIELDALGTDPALREEALAMAWARGTGHVLSARHREALAASAARRDGSASLDLPGGRAVREYGVLRIDARAVALSARARQVPAGAAEGRDGAAAEGRASVPVEDMDARGEERTLRVGHEVEWDGWRIALVRGASVPADATLTAMLPTDASDGLTVRSRRPGDRMAGPVPTKVQDVLTDAKVPARERSRLPLVVTRDGSVAWIPGVAKSWNGPSEGYVLVAYPPAARRTPHK